MICSLMKSQKKVNILWMNDFLIFCTTFSSEHKSNTDTRPSNITFREIFSLAFLFQIFVFCKREMRNIYNSKTPYLFIFLLSKAINLYTALNFIWVGCHHVATNSQKRVFIFPGKSLKLNKTENPV